MNPRQDITVADVDRWRAGLPGPHRAAEVEAAVRADPRLAAAARFGSTLATGLQPLPELAARRRTAGRRLRWGRVAGAGFITASVALAGLTLMLSPAVRLPLSGALAPDNAQMADAVQNQDFYAWLAAHPQAMEDAQNDDGSS